MIPTQTSAGTKFQNVLLLRCAVMKQLLHWGVGTSSRTPSKSVVCLSVSRALGSGSGSHSNSPCCIPEPWPLPVLILCPVPIKLPGPEAGWAIMSLYKPLGAWDSTGLQPVLNKHVGTSRAAIPLSLPYRGQSMGLGAPLGQKAPGGQRRQSSTWPLPA